MRKRKCIICKSVSISEGKDYIDYSCSMQKFKIVSCETCGFKFTSPAPKEEEIKKYYLSENYISHTNNKKGFVNWAYQKIRNYTIKMKVSLLKKHSKIGRHLDIGSGTGEFISACKTAGFLVEGIEPSEKAREQSIKNYEVKVFKENKLDFLKSESLDSISMWHVLEHVYDLEECLTNIKRVLKKNGVILVAVPNHESWDCSYYEEYWAAWDVPIHLWHFSKKNITRLFKTYNLELIRALPMFFDSFYISILSEKFKYGKQNLIKSLFVGLYSNMVGLNTQRGCSSTIYVFKKTK